ncbi:hypothetical protein BDFB_013965 [Asbolus verrucosus]|uniref:Uncharacterized protein n=1 Tax=Asbolus verrucosus TaxID=1661398 RepID=A0A482VCI8_ASBVE|nr:hypothetical protein BDFB_013965 [Asbolus verrucosus]
MNVKDCRSQTIIRVVAALLLQTIVFERVKCPYCS